MKRFILGIVASLALITASSYAAGVYIPPPLPVPGRLSIGVSGFYAQPSYDQFQYAGVVDNAVNSTTVDHRFVKPNYELGWSAHLRYLINAHDYIRIYYQYYHDTSRDAVTADAPGGILIPPLPPGALALGAPRAAHARVRIKYQSGSVILGHIWASGGGLAFNIFGGAKWASLDRDFDAEYSNFYLPQVAPPNNNQLQGSATIWSSSDFDGFGPVVGFGGQYLFGSTGFGLMARTSLAFLMGAVQSHFRATANLHAVDNQINFDFNGTLEDNADPGTRIVPNLNAKIGAIYVVQVGYPMKVVIGAGYKVDEYFNGFDRLIPVLGTSSHDIGFHGPYLDVTAII